MTKNKRFGNPIRGQAWDKRCTSQFAEFYKLLIYVTLSYFPFFLPSVLRSFVHLYHALFSFYVQQFIEKSLLNLIVLCSFSVLAIIVSATLTLTYVHRTSQIFVDSMRAYRKSLILVTSSIRLFSFMVSQRKLVLIQGITSVISFHF